MIEAPADPHTAPATPADARARSFPAWLSDVAGGLACIVAALLVLVPLAGPGMVVSHDGLLHVQRLISLDGALREGVLLPRWLPDLAYGYGQPLFLYYAPLAYLPALAARLAGASYLGSFAIASGLPLVLSGVAMYLLARSTFGPLAAAVSGIVYASLPYQLVDLYVRGALAESWAFVWLPLATWCLLNARTDGRLRWSIGLALALAGLILTHNVTALLFVPALGLLGLLLWLAPTASQRPRWTAPLTGFGLALGLSAWFWLPALAEKGLVQLGEIVEPDLFASFFLRGFPPFRLDLLYDYREPTSTAMGYPIFWPQVGLIQAVLSVLGGIAVIRARGPQRTLLLWALLLVIGGIALQLGPAARLYDLVPLLSFVQFPWRILALVGLGSALLAGGLVEHAVRGAQARAVLAGLVVVASLVTALARLEPEYTPIDERYLAADTTLRADMADYGLGTTHSGEYLPSSSGQRNAARFRKALLDDPPARGTSGVDQPSTLQISRMDWRLDRLSVDVSASVPDRLVIHQFAFPGWTAHIDGAPAATSTDGPFGLLAVDVPAGQHTVELTWEQTQLRAVAMGVSIVSLVTLVVLAWWGRLRSFRTRGRFMLLVAAGSVLVAWTSGAAPVASDDGGSRVWQPVDDRLVLVGQRVDSSRLDQDRVVTSTLTWFVREPPTSSYSARVEVTAANGVAQQSLWPYEPLSRQWQRGELVQTTIATRLPLDFPAGPAAITLHLDQIAGTADIALGQVLVPTTTHALSNVMSDGVTAVVPGLNVAAGGRTPVSSSLGGLWQGTSVRPGGAVDVDLRWQAASSTPDLAHEYVAVLALTTPGGDVLSDPGRPGDWFNPLPFWQAGDVVKQPIRLILPTSVTPGTYPFVARIYARDLARGGMAAPGASASRPRGRPIAEIPLGDLVVQP